jgi:hypothetical protein
MMVTATPEIGRAPKPGLERSARGAGGVGQGTPAPGEGYALTIASRECKRLVFDNAHDLEDVIVGVALVAAKRASLVGRGPTLGDAHVAMDLFGLRSSSPVSRETTAPFRGLAHSYSAQRRFVDDVSAAQLTSGVNDAASRH